MCQPATYLLVDKITGFVPPEFMYNAFGPALVFRTDGQPFTVKEMQALHKYNDDLMFLYGAGNDYVPNHEFLYTPEYWADF